MKYVYTATHFHFRYLIILIALVLSGCTHLTELSKNQKDYYLQGNIQNFHGKIPENATITLSVTQNKIAGEKEITFREYIILTKTESRKIPFLLPLQNELSSLPNQLSVSVRVEKEGKLIMMSDKLTPLTYQPNEKLTLIVNDS
ncbi:hypothetical protein ymoll0001_4660 [Yersinia mollaretii ATCC 43969]|uniref:Lipoprotein n=1 Tax=Yersinia mollaretii (strain ATCC 43969 / DSM 18520 / CIP 103324 / CNY 7263 / WAIP 204) TaxID=349967 RepID=A0ABP2ELM5_YERMW|nr:hypothetical protein [Yersinia mollaretii]EEQ11878.1 hypothetical protein ymoll0001_4660 [Yersinia mollaretii ATCC 43969]QKJ02819.1 hypothetical protein HRD69_07275 [Yersinia mollaretii ATCC 43969]